MKRTTIIETVIFLYAILFLYTGISKLIDYNTFKEQLSESPILGPFSSVASVLVPFTEFLIVLMLIIPRWRLKGLYAATGLMTAFTIYIVALISISDELPCSCGGIMSQLSWQQHIVFNVVFILLALWGIKLLRGEIKQGKKIWISEIQNSQSAISKSY